jgi:hypothetical protein
VQEPKLMTSGSPALARLSSGTCNSPPDWLTFFVSFFLVQWKSFRSSGCHLLIGPFHFSARDHLSRLSSGTCNSPPDWLTFLGTFFWSNSNLLGAADAISLLAHFIFQHVTIWSG